VCLGEGQAGEVGSCVWGGFKSWANRDLTTCGELIEAPYKTVCVSQTYSIMEKRRGGKGIDKPMEYDEEKPESLKLWGQGEKFKGNRSNGRAGREDRHQEEGANHMESLIDKKEQSSEEYACGRSFY